MPFQKGNTLGLSGRPKGTKNRLTNDVRQIFHKVYERLGEKKGISGEEAFLEWAEENQTEFYRLYGKMIPATQELAGDLHEDFVDTLVFEEEQVKLVDVVIVGEEEQKQLPSGEDITMLTPQEAKPSGTHVDPDVNMV